MKAMHIMLGMIPSEVNMAVEQWCTQGGMWGSGRAYKMQ